MLLFQFQIFMNKETDLTVLYDEQFFSSSFSVIGSRRHVIEYQHFDIFNNNAEKVLHWQLQFNLDIEW